MGRMREFTVEETTTAASTAPISEALLITTMCIVGLPVEVHIKDGSIFSGIFHTASADNSYGIALKKARMIKKGIHNANVANGGLIDTLVVLPGDLVQVVAKGVMLPADSVPGEATRDDGLAVSGTSVYPRGCGNGAVSAGELINQERQVGVGRSRAEEDDYHHDSEALEVLEINHSSTLNGSYARMNIYKENQAMTILNHLTNALRSADDASLKVKLVNKIHDKELLQTESVASEVSTPATLELDVTRNSLPVPAEVAPYYLPANRIGKESKLNPSAKGFSPSLPTFRPTTPPMSTVPSVAYVPNSVPAVQVAGTQPEVGIGPVVPHSSWPAKFSPYVTSTAANADGGFQYNQPITRHIATRIQPIRHGAQYQPIQAVPPYVHPNPQNAMFGRPGQLVYVHPVTREVIQASATLSQAPRPLLASHPIHVAKHEGIFPGQALQVSVTAPLMVSGPQQYMMPSHVQLSQPLFSSMRPVPIIGPTFPYSAKFP